MSHAGINRKIVLDLASAPETLWWNLYFRANEARRPDAVTLWFSRPTPQRMMASDGANRRRRSGASTAARHHFGPSLTTSNWPVRESE